MGLYIGIGAAVLVVGGGLAAWLMRPAPPEPTPPPTVAEVVTTTLPAVEATPEASPEATPEAPPVTEESAPPSTLAQIEPVATPPPPVATPPPAARPTPTPSPRATPTPRPTPTPAAKPAATPTPPSVSPEAARAAQVAGLLTQAEAAVAAGRMDQAVGHYDEILKLEPQNARATQGKAAAAIAIASLKKNFVTSRTVFLGKPKKGPAGFEDNEAADPDYQGKIEFEFVPKNVKPGDSVAVKAFLLNEGKKAIKVGSITVTVIADGARSNSPGAPQGGEIAPGQRGLLAQLTTAWKPTTKAWAVEVTMISGRSETYSARANWR